MSRSVAKGRGHHIPCEGRERMDTRCCESIRSAGKDQPRAEQRLARRHGSWHPLDPSDCAWCRPAVGLDRRLHGRVEGVERKGRKEKKKEKKKTPHGRRQHAGTEGKERKKRTRPRRPCVTSSDRGGLDRRQRTQRRGEDWRERRKRKVARRPRAAESAAIGPPASPVRIRNRGAPCRAPTPGHRPCTGVVTSLGVTRGHQRGQRGAR